MAGVKVAAVQAAYTLMDQEACVDKAVKLLHQAAAEGAGIVVFPEVFIPGNPIWIDTVPIWDGDGDWYALLVEQAVVVPGPVTDTLGRRRPRDRHLPGDRGGGTRAARHHDLQHHPLLRTRRHPARQAPQADAHRLRTHRVGHGRRLDAAGHRHPVRAAVRADLLGELHAADPLLPLQPGRGHLDRAHPRPGRRLDRHHAAHRPRGPLLRHRRQSRACTSTRSRPTSRTATGSGAPIRATSGSSPATASSSTPTAPILAGPARHEETILYADIDLAAVRAARRYFDPVGHYHRPDIFQLHVDTRPRPSVVLQEPPSDLSELS